MRQLRLSLSLIILVLAASLFVTGCGSSKYAAKVNDSYITKEKYQQTVNEVIKYYETNARKLKSTEQTALKKETLDRLVDEELIAQAAALKGISVADKQVDDYINNIKQRVGDPKKFQELLKDRAYSENNYRARLKVKFLTKALSDAVTKDITDSIKKKQAFDKYMADLKNNASIKIYEKF